MNFSCWQLSKIAVSVAILLAFGEAAFAAPPFANTHPAPTTSLYLQLYQLYPRQQAQYNQTTYQTIVKPRLENQQRAAVQQAQLDRLERQQQAVRNSIHLPPPALGPVPNKLGASKNIRSTGHGTRFLDGRRFQDQTHFFPSRPIR